MAEAPRAGVEDAAAFGQVTGGAETLGHIAIEPTPNSRLSKAELPTASAASPSAAESSRLPQVGSGESGNDGDDREGAKSSRPIADTSYLMPFGVQGHRKLLKELYPDAVAAPEIVRDELTGLAHRHKYNPRGRAAQAMLSRGTAVVYETLDSGAEDTKTRLMDALHADAVSRGRATGTRSNTSAENAGEAECMCIALKKSQIMLCNDNGARRVARANRIKTRTTARDLVTLVEKGNYTAVQMTQMARRMSDLDIGDTISGPGYFRRPPR